MALPLLNFPFGLLGSLAVLLMPEITQAHIEGQTARLNALLDRMLRLTGYFSMLAGTLFWVWGRPLAQLLYHSPEAGFYLETLAPAMPLMYLESMVDGAMKGIGEQKAAFRYSVWDAVLRIGGVAVLLPRYGMRGFLTVILLSSFYTCAANTGRLLLSSGTGHAFRRWLGAPLLAAAAAVWGEVPVEAIQKVGSTFTGVEHRIEPVRTLDGVLYYNDSIGTSPTRTIAGLRSFDRKVILIAGGYDKHIPYEPLAPEIIAHVKNLVLMGATGPRIEQAVRECSGFDEAALPIQHADNMQHAVELARAAAKPGDIIILSPASASFDLYPNFEVRGREFKKIVNALK